MSMKNWAVLLPAFFVATVFLILTPIWAYAAPLENVPVTVIQPDGTVLHLFASGDEFYNWLHDTKGYTIIQDHDTGYYVYADLDGEDLDRELIPTEFIAGIADPALVGLSPFLNVSPEKKAEIRRASPLDTSNQPAWMIREAPHTGTMTNLVVFIRFSGEPEFTDLPSKYTDMLNNSTAGANSLRNYYQEVSYNALTINSNLYPTPGSTIISYKDSHTRGYFQPYDATTNPGGYAGGDDGTERRLREHTLLRDAVNYVNGLGQFPGAATIDADSDGYVDSVTFVVYGSPTGWSSLLWPHQWALSSYNVAINGKRVWTYQFELQSMISVGVLAHEEFHVLGAPDLYHYTNNGIQPVGGWDLMEATQNPPQHMGCFMKFKYGHWISSIPELTVSATQIVNPLTSSTNNCYKIASPNSTTEYFVVEYRRQTGTFEASLPGTGLLVYRINAVATGNASGPPDEVYIYRPGGTTSANGNVNTANFSSNVGRTAIYDTTNPSSFLSNGSAGGLNISNVGASGTTISFDFDYGAGGKPPAATLVSPSGTISTNQPTYIWNAVSNATWYYLWVNDNTGNRIKTWYTSAQAGCASGTGVCSVTPTTVLADGAGQWWIQTWNSAGYGPWSAAMAFFTLPPGSKLPGSATLISPTGAITDNTPTYSWNAVSNATWYYLWVNDSTGNRIKTWYKADQAGCASGTGVCSVTPTTGLANGAGQWWIQTWNSAGYGPWSAAMALTMSTGGGLPGAATPISPKGTITDNTPTYSWHPVSNATWYYLWVNDSKGNRIKTWYTAAQAGCASGAGVCSVTPTTGLANGAAQWWIQTWNSAGYGPWSDSLTFTVASYTYWGVYNMVACVDGSALTFQGTLDGVTKYSVTRGPSSQPTWEGYQATSPGYKILYFSVYGNCTSTWSGSWSPLIYFEAGSRYQFATDLDSYGSLTIVLYRDASQAVAGSSTEIESLDTYIIGIGGNDGLKSYDGATSAVQVPGF